MFAPGHVIECECEWLNFLWISIHFYGLTAIIQYIKAALTFPVLREHRLWQVRSPLGGNLQKLRFFFFFLRHPTCVAVTFGVSFIFHIFWEPKKKAENRGEKFVSTRNPGGAIKPIMETRFVDCCGSGGFSTRSFGFFLLIFFEKTLRRKKRSLRIF